MTTSPSRTTDRDMICKKKALAEFIGLDFIVILILSFSTYMPRNTNEGPLIFESDRSGTGSTQFHFNSCINLSKNIYKFFGTILYLRPLDSFYKFLFGRT